MKKRTFLGFLAAGAASTVAEFAEAAGSMPPPGVSFLVRFADRKGAVLVWRSEGVWTSTSARAAEIGRAAVTTGDAEEWEYYGFDNGKWVKKGGGEQVTFDVRSAFGPNDEEIERWLEESGTLARAQERVRAHMERPNTFMQIYTSNAVSVVRKA